MTVEYHRLPFLGGQTGSDRGDLRNHERWWIAGRDLPAVVHFVIRWRYVVRIERHVGGKARTSSSVTPFVCGLKYQSKPMGFGASVAWMKRSVIQSTLDSWIPFHCIRAMLTHECFIYHPWRAGARIAPARLPLHRLVGLEIPSGLDRAAQGTVRLLLLVLDLHLRVVKGDLLGRHDIRTTRAARLVRRDQHIREGVLQEFLLIAARLATGEHRLGGYGHPWHRPGSAWA